MTDKPVDAIQAHAAESIGELTNRLRQQQIAADYGVFALKTRDLTRLLQEASRACAEGLRCAFCKVLEYMPDEGDFLVRAGVGWAAGVVGHARLEAGTASPAGYAFQTERPVITNHLAEETRFRTPELLIRHGVKRAINVLIRAGGERFGVLEADADALDDRRFTEVDQAFLQTFANMIGVAIERQRAEEALKREQLLLQEALRRQEVLAIEVGHRVKNSLAMVASLLGMQRRGSSDPDVQQALADAEARVQTVAQLHDRLWRHRGAQTVDLSAFFSELRALLVAISPTHSLSVEVDPVAVSADTGGALALITTELVTNAFKYAYPTGEGRIEVSIRQIGEDALRLRVRDYGVGSPAAFASAASNSLGAKLIAALSHQLGGRGEWRGADPGIEFSLEVQIGRRH